MSPWDVLVWIIVIFLAVVFFICAIALIALVVSFVRELRKPRGRAQQIHLMDRDIRRQQ